MKRKPTLLESFLPIIVMLLLLAIVFGVYGLSPEPLLILSSIFAGFIAMRLGVNWEVPLKGFRERLDIAMPAILVLISIGILIGTWMHAGTIRMMIYSCIEMISPQFIVLIAFIVSAIISIVTGTSWGSAGTVGVALMGIATGLGVSLPATAGAVVAGAYFGDKLSPLSDTTNLAPIAAGSKLYEHIKHMFYTTIPAAVISMIAYLIVGFNISSDDATAPEEMTSMLTTLDDMFKWNILLLLPAAMVLYGSIRKKPTLPTIIFSSVVAGAIAIFYQGFSFPDVFASTVTGFDVSMIAKEGFNPDTVPEQVTELVTQGGMQSMTSVILIAFSAFAFAGIITKSGALDVIMATLLKIV